MFIIPFVIIGSVVIVVAIILIKIIISPKRVKQLAQLYKQNKFSLAIKVAKQILAKESRNHEAHFYLGMSYLAENKPELALMELKLVNQLGIFDGSINETQFRKTIAELYSRFNQNEEAQKEYLVLLKLNPDNPSFYFEAGKLFETRGHPDKAVKYYRKTIDLDKRHADAYGRLGSILHRAKKLPEAKDALEAAVRLQPNNATAGFTLGKICKEAKDFQGALVHFEKASKENDLKAKSLMERGTCYISLGDLERAQSELERALKIFGDDSVNELVYSRYLLAYCFEQVRKYEEAIDQWEMIQAIRPNFRDVSAKLSQYQDLRSDDKIKDYLTVSDEEFIEICKVILAKTGMDIIESSKTETGYDFTVGESQTKWRNTKKLPVLYCFVRETELIEEPVIRDFNEKIKASTISKGVFVSSSGYSRGAKEFAESRPIDLIDKDKLLVLLNEKKG